MNRDCARSNEMPPTRRSKNGCLCCHSDSLYRETTVISPFLAKRAMRQTERACVAAQLGKTREQRGIGRAREQHREERIFLRARGIDLVDVAADALVLGVKIGPQDRAAHAGRGLDREHALSGNARPVRNRRL